jgi:uncharacterized zinc-type alcohol dehydrogenase-like protein
MSQTNNYKLEKYKTKLLNENNSSKKKLYELKIQQYGGDPPKPTTITYVTDEIRQFFNPTDALIKPTPIPDLSYYKPPQKQTEQTQTEQKQNVDKPTLVFGYGAINEKSMTVPVIFERRPLNEDDVMFDVHYVGVCHSDWHTILNEWKNSKYPVVAGHEMTGIVTAVGSAVTKFAVGARVALSPLYNSCQECKLCRSGEEQYCENGTTETYNQYDRLKTDEGYPTGPVTYGGYSNIMIAKERFLYEFPKNLPMDQGAPLLCAGITVYNALKALGVFDLAADKRGEIKIGVAGIGGLGHLALKLCKAEGIKTVALTTTQEKMEDCIKFSAPGSSAIWMKDLDTVYQNQGTLDYILCTLPFKHDLDPYFKLIKVHGTMSIVGAFYSLNPDFSLIIRTGKKIEGSNIAGTVVADEFLKYCSNKTANGIDVLPQIELIKFDGLNATHNNLVTSKCRYRYVIDVRGSMALKDSTQ